MQKAQWISRKPDDALLLLLLLLLLPLQQSTAHAGGPQL
jgi:hypothetical protein